MQCELKFSLENDPGVFFSLDYFERVLNGWEAHPRVEIELGLALPSVFIVEFRVLVHQNVLVYRIEMADEDELVVMVLQ